MIDVIVSITRVDAADVVGHTVDLSLGGIRFVCPALEVGMGELLHITLDLRDTKLSMAGKAVRITKPNAYALELALSFVEVDASTLELLGVFLEDSQEA
jgi:hypothetical protein